MQRMSRSLFRRPELIDIKFHSKGGVGKREDNRLLAELVECLNLENKLILRKNPLSATMDFEKLELRDHDLQTRQ